MPGRGSPLDWRAKVELFEEIRREYEFGVGTIAGVARKVKVHRRMVREAIASALPKARKKTERPHPKLQAAIPFIDAILQGDRQAPRKQRHTAHRIWVRLRQELPNCPVAERTVREAAFHCAFTNATQQAFLEAHELAFAWFGRVFHRLRYV